MSSNASFKRWHFIHTWSSLICTVFLLLLCLTGLPLIFNHELDDLLGNHIAAPEMPAGTPAAPLDKLADAARAYRPGEVIQYMIWERGEDETATLVTAPRPDTHPDSTQSLVSDTRTGGVLGQPPSRGLVFILLKLHTDMFAGLPGKLFLGFMGLLFVVSIVSGVVVYGPLMRKLDFGAIRRQKGRRLRWLDIHNLLGTATLVWVTVVGVTGVVCTLADVLLTAWRNDQLAEMVAPYKNLPPPTHLASLDVSVANAKAATPGMVPSFIAFPGTNFSSGHHYAIFMRGDTPLTSNLLRPVLVDAETGRLTESRELPWYVTAVLVAKPLHFGDYAGMPLKLMWALLDVATLVVLGSGVYLWFARRGQSRRRLEKLHARPGQPAAVK
ncbi:PepSY domain-containing protein [Herbaspirillum sp. LeCh32-8]|uniref:PepSY-associated TM helix domain-containing protein n=1 Tax=Herbaspirillum sp. LeCh32-8 TaxID=2821356 RepID=UPI001AE342A9|nr:PepSY domain-containing protein [Herbaspirillum sp. LeCh32-8]MBP0599383.1 PepSY domain-containing protein [Herbaspirillum sp. LeCh32-8]